MADSMTSRRETGGVRQGAGRGSLHPALFGLLFFAFGPLNAEELPDPTRPPAGLIAPLAAPASGVVVSQPPGLQSIIISQNRRAAIIGGETVELGGKYGDAKLIEVNEGSVVLRSAQGRQVMTLFPDVKITAAKRAEGELRGPAKIPAKNETKNGQKLKTKLQSPESNAQPEGRKADQAAAGEGK